MTRKKCELVFSGERRIIRTFSTGVWVIFLVVRETGEYNSPIFRFVCFR